MCFHRDNPPGQCSQWQLYSLCFLFDQINRILALKGPLFIQLYENLIELLLSGDLLSLLGCVVRIWRERAMISIEGWTIICISFWQWHYTYRKFRTYTVLDIIYQMHLKYNIVLKVSEFFGLVKSLGSATYYLCELWQIA